MSDVTRILSAIEEGDPSAAEQLLPLVYDELRKLAARRWPRKSRARRFRQRRWCMRPISGWWMWRRRGNGTRVPLLCGGSRSDGCILADTLVKERQKRSGNRHRFDIDAIDVAVHAAPDQLLAVYEALNELQREDPSVFDLVKLRYFAGLNIEQSATALGISTATAYRKWNYARAWLHCHLLETGDS